jgi:hypothetical protein
MTEQELVEKAARAFFEKMFERTPAPATFDAIMAADRLIGSENEFMAGMRAALSVIRKALSEPSEAMQNALIDAVKDGIAINDDVHRTARHAYRAMIAASPIGEK